MTEPMRHPMHRPTHKRRYAAVVEYDGSLFCGWQRQAGVATVQEALERALGRVADETVAVHAAGRTDTGVHACGQVIHFETASERSLYSWRRGVNTWLPEGVVMVRLAPVATDFHARFSALARHYRYVILNRSTPPAWLRRKVTWEYRALDHEAMAAAAAALVGRHDFSAFRAASCQSRSAVRNVHRLEVRRSGDWVWLDVEADGFLHHMVRNIAGALCAVGRGDNEPGWVAATLACRDRTRGGVTAPAAGLYLVRVSYPPPYDGAELSGPEMGVRFWS